MPSRNVTNSVEPLLSFFIRQRLLGGETFCSYNPVPGGYFQV
jgi:hypothetical protein